MTLAPFPGSYWIQAGWIAGPYPRSHEITALVASGVTLFLDLTEEGELPPYSPSLPGEIKHLRMPIRDFSIPTHQHMERILQIVDAALAEGQTLYLHCHGGIGRTGTVVGCHLVRCGLTGKEALLEIRRLRSEAGCDPDSPESAAQCSLVRLWPRGLAHDG